jgi:hypothetical protein
MTLQRARSLQAGPVSEFIAATRVPLRLACNGSTGHPLLASLWFAPDGPLLWCATQCDAVVARRLGADPRCTIEVSEESMPYRGVRGRATATLHPERGPEILDRLIERYLGSERPDFARWLRERAEREVAIAIEPLELRSWDYTRRMDGAS